MGTAVGDGAVVGTGICVSVGAGRDDEGVWFIQALSIRTIKMDRINL
jgi:hypothetical protein